MRGNRVMKWASVFVVFLVFVSQCANAKGTNNEVCASIYDEMGQKIVDMTLKQFDQTPNSGWRILEAKECYKEAAALIGHFRTMKKLNLSQLYFHAGQMLALAGDSDAAVREMASSVVPPESLRNNFLWNDYVYAVIAFLNRDEKELLARRDRLEMYPEPNAANIQLVDKLIKNFGASYLEILKTK